MEFSKIFKSKPLTWLIVGLVELALLAVVFRAGMMAGFYKANFSYRWGEEYQNNFGGPRGGWLQAGQGKGGMMGGPMGGFKNDDFIAPHGIVGTIIKIDTSTIIVKDAKNTEQSLLITPETTIRSGNADVKSVNLKVNDKIVVLGAPSSTGQIEVKFIRVFTK